MRRNNALPSKILNGNRPNVYNKKKTPGYKHEKYSNERLKSQYGKYTAINNSRIIHTARELITLTNQ